MLNLVLGLLAVILTIIIFIIIAQLIFGFIYYRKARSGELFDDLNKQMERMNKAFDKDED